MFPIHRDQPQSRRLLLQGMGEAKPKKKGVNSLSGSTACGLKMVPLTKGVWDI